MVEIARSLTLAGFLSLSSQKRHVNGRWESPRTEDRIASVAGGVRRGTDGIVSPVKSAKADDCFVACCVEVDVT